MGSGLGPQSPILLNISNENTWDMIFFPVEKLTIIHHYLKTYQF